MKTRAIPKWYVYFDIECSMWEVFKAGDMEALGENVPVPIANKNDSHKSAISFITKILLSVFHNPFHYSSVPDRSWTSELISGYRRAVPVAWLYSPFNASNQNIVADPDYIGSVEQDELMSMVYPPGSDADDNPLYMLCCNDTCSFTWTGAQHINQVRREVLN